MDSDESRQRLEDERQRLDTVKSTLDLSSIHEETEKESLSELSSSAQHQADLGTETFNRERDLSILESIEMELIDVEHALKRLDEGTYGKCEACGASIEEDRLIVLPAARLCLNDQTRFEKEVRVANEAI